MARAAARRMSSHCGNAAPSHGTEHGRCLMRLRIYGGGGLTDRVEGFADEACRSETDELSLGQRRPRPWEGEH
jgi:hypothetical protein